MGLPTPQHHEHTVLDQGGSQGMLTHTFSAAGNILTSYRDSKMLLNLLSECHFVPPNIVITTFPSHGYSTKVIKSITLSIYRRLY